MFLIIKEVFVMSKNFIQRLGKDVFYFFQVGGDVYYIKMNIDNSKQKAQVCLN